MSTPDASQYTQFRRYASVSGDAIGSVGFKINPFNTSYTLPVLTASSQALFLPSANKQEKFGTLPVHSGPLTLNSPITNPVVPTGGYNLFTFTPTQSGWYRIVIDGFGDNDMDLVVGYGNSEINIPALIDFDLNDHYNALPDTAKVLAFSGTNNDAIDSYFSSGCTYQVLVIGYDGNLGGTYTITVRDNNITSGVTLTSSFDFTDAYQLYRFVAPSSNTYRFLLDFDFPPNDADIFVSQANTTLDIQGCINYDRYDDPAPASMYAAGVNEGPDSFTANLVSGAVYEVMVYMFSVDSITATYDLSIFID